VGRPRGAGCRTRRKSPIGVGARAVGGARLERLAAEFDERDELARSREEELSSREHGGNHLDRADEWSATIVYLREFADESGLLPDAFDGLIEEVFEPILEPRERRP
jgi:hypothetical protein